MAEPNDPFKARKPVSPQGRFVRLLLWVIGLSILAIFFHERRDYGTLQHGQMVTALEGRESPLKLSEFDGASAIFRSEPLLNPRYQELRAAGVRGQLATATRLSRELARTEWAEGHHQAAYCAALDPAYLTLYGLRDPRTAIALADAVLEELPQDPVRSESGLVLADFFARAGQPHRARAFADVWAEKQMIQPPHAEYERIQALLALASGNPVSAIARLRKLESRVDGCGARANFDLGIAYEALAQRDSAITAFERHLGSLHAKERATESFSMPHSLTRLGELYEWRAVSGDGSTREGDLKRALAVYERLLDLWAKADSEFDARINAIQERTRTLKNQISPLPSVPL